MLRWRLTLGTLLIALLAALCYWDNHVARAGLVLLPVALLLAGAATHEILGLFAARGNKLVAPSVLCSTLVVVASAGAPLLWEVYPADCPVGRLGWLSLGLAAGFLIVLLGEIRRYMAPGQVTVRLALSLLAVVYVGLLVGFLVQLRLLEFPNQQGALDRRWGMVALLATIVCVKMCDTGAYTVGRLIGKHKMAPRISPGKTWEGFVGGLAFAACGALVALIWLLPAFGLETSSGPLWWIAFGVGVGCAGVIGDLAESLLKRDAGQKDSSRWMPGFGGVLDVLDSLLAAAPVAYVFWAAGWMGP